MYWEITNALVNGTEIAFEVSVYEDNTKAVLVGISTGSINDSVFDINRVIDVCNIITKDFMIKAKDSALATALAAKLIGVNGVV